ncbi:hypothetical protein [Vibrio rarus]|uniref:hypothetical protein n=1 Tax=Vibrio rarus TaxID=413403 RepID=UPI0021C2C697|nr:hypothetical protein [Vibrio rarus]
MIDMYFYYSKIAQMIKHKQFSSIIVSYLASLGFESFEPAYIDYYRSALEEANVGDVSSLDNLITLLKMVSYKTKQQMLVLTSIEEGNPPEK